MTRPTALLSLLLLACGSKWEVVDEDGDGVSPADGDCWDKVEGPTGSGFTGADIHPGAEDVPYNGVDEDCAGNDDYDLDGDGWVPLAAQLGLPTIGVPDSGLTHQGSGDCWDRPDESTPPEQVVVASNVDVDDAGQPYAQPAAADVHPAAADPWYDGADQDCAGNDDFDQDGDTFASATHKQPDGALGDDCIDGSGRDEANPSGAAAAAVNPEAAEVWYDGTDDNCDLNDCDADGDGYTADPLAAGFCDNADCADEDPDRYPDASIAEIPYNGTDDNCDPIDGDGDMDGDGRWAADYLDHTTPDDTVALPEALDDCWDDTTLTPEAFNTLPGFDALSADAVYPGALDRPYDGVPQDCATDDNADGVNDDFDWDGDGHATSAWADHGGLTGDDCVDCASACAAPTGEEADWCAALCDGDAENPGAVDPALINPAAAETPYDGTDQDCDLWNDWDADYDAAVRAGDEAHAADAACGGAACATGDCDDAAATIRPGAADAWYSGVDEDCDGRDDYDADEDGYVSTANVGLPTTYIPGSGALPGNDCDDGSAATSPAAAEDCNTTIDDNCDGDTNNEGAIDCASFFADADADTYGDPAAAACLCEANASFPVADNTDCDDTLAARNPAATELCDAANIDEDCDGFSDNDDVSALASTKTTYYRDGDADFYLPASPSTGAYCDQPAPSGGEQYLMAAESLGTDCDDADAAINPGATEVCDGGTTDEDCDSLANDADPSTDPGSYLTWYLDADADDYLAASPASTATCERPSASAGQQYLLATESLGADCDDSTDLAHPGLDEVCNDDLDNDCDGTLGTRVSGGTCEITSAALSTANGLFTGGSGAQVGHISRIVPDLDGDGLDDLILGAPGEGITGTINRGAAYILTGLGPDLDPEVPLSQLASTGGHLTGAAAGDRLGATLSAGHTGAGPYADLVIGAPLADGLGALNLNAGRFYIVTGSPTTGAGTLSSAGSLLGGGKNEFLGFATSMAGDTDGDGRAELLVSAPQDPLASFGGTAAAAGAGYVYLFADSTVAAANPSAGTALAKLTGAATGDATGYAVGFSDVDGDGMSELLIGAPQGTGAVATSGLVYVVDSSASGTITLSSSTASLLRGTAAAERAGIALAGNGDEDGDGYDDVLVGADAASAGKGAAYLVHGSAAGIASLTLSAASATLSGLATNDKAGFSVDFVPDIDGDGADEVIVGAWKATGALANTGAAYLLYGGGLSGALSLSTADATLSGSAAAERAGYNVAGQGDLNGDGRGDFLVGSPYQNLDATTTTYEGSAQLFLGLTQ